MLGVDELPGTAGVVQIVAGPAKMQVSLTAGGSGEHRGAG